MKHLQVKIINKIKISLTCYLAVPHHWAHLGTQGRRNLGEAGGAAAPFALYQEGQGVQRSLFNLKDCLGKIANCQKC